MKYQDLSKGRHLLILFLHYVYYVLHWHNNSIWGRIIVDSKMLEAEFVLIIAIFWKKIQRGRVKIYGEKEDCEYNSKWSLKGKIYLESKYNSKNKDYQKS